jgi:transcriptional regulator with XRE-family HTH domain
VRRYSALAEEIASFVGEPGPAGFQHISREERDSTPPVKLDVALSFLDAFYRGPFLRELNRPLKIILVDGEFYRKDNRIEFTDAYDSLLHINEQISLLDSRLSPEGEFGETWRLARNEMGPSASRRRKMQAVARSAEEEAERIARRAGFGLSTLVNILRGFLKGEAGGRYDSLANLSYLDGRSNKEFLRSLENAKDRCERALALLAELSGLDLG